MTQIEQMQANGLGHNLETYIALFIMLIVPLLVIKFCKDEIYKYIFGYIPGIIFWLGVFFLFLEWTGIYV